MDNVQFVQVFDKAIAQWCQHAVDLDETYNASYSLLTNLAGMLATTSNRDATFKWAHDILDKMKELVDDKFPAKVEEHG